MTVKDDDEVEWDLLEFQKFRAFLAYTQLFSKSNLAYCLLTVDLKTLFSSP